VYTQFCDSEDEAEHRIEKLMEEKPKLRNYIIKEISTQPITLYLYKIEVMLKFNNGRTKDHFFNVKAETEDEALKIVHSITHFWRGVVATELISID
ncbi:MAG: hypothetical protein R6V86_05140, partial [Spirochaetia bacterium]